MDPRLLIYYERELQYMREMGAEFASEFPKIAGRLGLESFECSDPYVERLLEGFSFLARVQLKLDSQFPRFTGQLLEMVYPQYMAPTPSMAVVQLQPDLTEGSLASGFTVPRNTVLRSLAGKGDQTNCEFRTAHDIKLWPIELVEAEYFSRDVASLQLPDLPNVKAGIRFRLQTTAGVTFDKMSLDSLPIFMLGNLDLPMHLYEQLMANVVALIVRPPDRPVVWQEVLDASHVRALGFADREALLPTGSQSFQGYRLLQEYMAFPQRFLFAELAGLSRGVKRCKGKQLELIVLLDRHDRFLESRITASNFGLFCTPAINLFPKRADRIHLEKQNSEHHVVPDRTRPMDFEIYSVNKVTGYGSGDDVLEQDFLPFYSQSDRSGQNYESAFFSLIRKPRVLSSKQRERGTRSAYVGSEVFLSLVDSREAPHNHNLRQLGVQTFCTNRDLPQHMPIGQTRTDFTLEASMPVQAIRCVSGPTKPRPSLVHVSEELSWRLINHLTLNYLSLVDSDPHQGAVALRELLSLYAETSDASLRKQVDGVRSISCTPITRRIPRPGPIAYGRGLQLKVTFEETAFEGFGVYLLGAVLEQFFARYVSLNSFTETIALTRDRGEIMRWPARIGRRQII